VGPAVDDGSRILDIGSCTIDIWYQRNSRKESYPPSRISRETCRRTLQDTARHCKTLQDTARHCKTPQHTATHCNTLQHTATIPTFINISQVSYLPCSSHNATHCNTLHCSTLQRTQLATVTPTFINFARVSYISFSLPHTHVLPTFC